MFKKYISHVIKVSLFLGVLGSGALLVADEDDGEINNYAELNRGTCSRLSDGQDCNRYKQNGEVAPGVCQFGECMGRNRAENLKKVSVCFEEGVPCSYKSGGKRYRGICKNGFCAPR